MHVKKKVGVERLDGTRLWRTLNIITKNLGFIIYIERRNHKIFNRGMIYTAYKSLRNRILPILLILLIRKWRWESPSLIRGQKK